MRSTGLALQRWRRLGGGAQGSFQGRVLKGEKDRSRRKFIFLIKGSVLKENQVVDPTAQWFCIYPP